jgi:UDP-glucose 4-epimerase
MELERQHYEVVPVQRATVDYAVLDAAACIHLAEPSILTDSATPIANVDRARRVLAAPFRRVVYVSSGGVYGDQATTPRRETDATIASNPYLAAKLQVEELMRDARCAIARLGNVYGTGMSSKNVLSEIRAQLEGAEPIGLRSFAPIRDYVHVVDVARALVDLVGSSFFGIVNIATGIGTSVRTLAGMMSGPQRSLVELDPREGTSHLVLAIERAHAELGWSPSIQLERGVSDLMTGRTE